MMQLTAFANGAMHVVSPTCTMPSKIRNATSTSMRPTTLEPANSCKVIGYTSIQAKRRSLLVRASDDIPEAAKGSADDFDDYEDDEDEDIKFEDFEGVKIVSSEKDKK